MSRNIQIGEIYNLLANEECLMHFLKEAEKKEQRFLLIHNIQAFDSCFNSFYSNWERLQNMSDYYGMWQEELGKDSGLSALIRVLQNAREEFTEELLVQRRLMETCERSFREESRAPESDSRYVGEKPEAKQTMRPGGLLGSRGTKRRTAGTEFPEQFGGPEEGIKEAKKQPEVPQSKPISEKTPECAEESANISKGGVCPTCGREIPAGAMFCAFCGAAKPISEKTPERAEGSANISKGGFCPMCGQKVSAGAMFCCCCGYNLRTSTVSESSAGSAEGSDSLTVGNPQSKTAQPSSAREETAQTAIAQDNAQSLNADEVQFRAAAADRLQRGSYFEMRLMMYREDDYARADREMMELGSKVKAASSSVCEVERGQKIRVVLQSQDIAVEDGTAEMVWNGRYSVCSFELFLPQDYEKRQLRLKARVYSGLTVLTDLRLLLNVEESQNEVIPVEKCRILSAFISYASEDRSRVSARIQGMQRVRPDMDLFFDVESLRSGEYWEPRLYQEIEKRDLLYLFWSHHAAASEWVQREWRYALKCKGLEAIEPVPLEPPNLCPPPEELSGRHFNDWTLRYEEFG